MGQVKRRWVGLVYCVGWIRMLTLNVWIINSVSFWNLISNSLWWLDIGWLVVVIIECDFSLSRRSLCFDWSMVSILDSILDSVELDVLGCSLEGISSPLSSRLFDDEEDISRIDKTEGFWRLWICVGGSVGGCCVVLIRVPWLDEFRSEERDLFWLVVRTRFCLLSSLICSFIDPLLFHPRDWLLNLVYFSTSLSLLQVKLWPVPIFNPNSNLSQSDIKTAFIRNQTCPNLKSDLLQ